jgi:four helix bundle protein
MRPEEMTVYAVARDLGKVIDRLVARLAPKMKRIADHMERSMESAGLNLAEGLSAYRPGVKTSAFEISRKEIGEVRKAVERALDKRGITQREHDEAMVMSNSMIAMLTVMIKQQEKRKKEEDR